MAKHIVLGVSGGIAAYKSAELIRQLRERGHRVTVVASENALRFIGVATLEALSGEPVITSLWENAHHVPHVALGKSADLVVVAPATADLLARATHGIADDPLTNILLTAQCPVLLAPAMHTEMWNHPATARNVHTLRERGLWILDPASGRLTGADSGQGRLPEPAFIADVADDLLAHVPQRNMVGLRVVISAGGTREEWDPVRFIGNRSSGLQGIALARTALLRGAEVILVAGSVDHPLPPVQEVITIDSAAQLAAAMSGVVFNRADRPDIVVMAAAVADFRPATESDAKISKVDGVPSLDLSQNEDILASLVRERASDEQPIIVGFAAETVAADHGQRGSLQQLAEAKLARKGCNVIVANDVSEGRIFGESTNSVVIVSHIGDPRVIEHAAKGEISQSVWNIALEELTRVTQG